MAQSSVPKCSAWLALLKSGVDPVVIGLAMGLVAYAGPAEREELEQEWLEAAEQLEQ